MEVREVMEQAQELLGALKEQLDRGVPTNDSARFVLAKCMEGVGGSLSDLIDQFEWSARKAFNDGPPSYKPMEASQ